ncbi:hypothetical protein HYV11_03745 [Candidatus Dependentiae bacterium]|nr:hypothetical protein [Candidatus Dependentiae bacterium]
MYKNKMIKLFIFMFLSLFIKITAKHIAEKKDTESISRQEVDLISFFYRPINFNQEGISYYFKYMYNHPEYTNYLSYNLSHMIQFLNYGKESSQSEAFAASVVKLFMQKIKATPYVDAESYVEFLPKFAEAILPFLEKKEATFLQEIQATLKEKLINVFNKYFSYFQKNPDAFMTSLSEQLAKQTNQLHTAQHVEIEQLKKDILRFIELCTNKLIWSSKDDIQVWHVCNKLGYEVQQCLDKKILPNQDAFDDICWSIIHRFCYFLELSAPTLSHNFYEQIMNDLKTKPLILTSATEQEDLITTKRSHLLSRIEMYKDIHHQNH